MRRLITGLMLGLAVSALAIGQEQPKQEPPQPQPLNPQRTVLLDTAGKRVLLKSKVVLREGVLELLCCKHKSKEHESILSLDADAYVVHTALLALKAKTGRPAVYKEDGFEPPTGQSLKIELSWVDAQGKKQQAPAKSWIRNVTRRFFVEKLEKPADLKIPEELDLRYDNKHKELAWFGPMSDKQKAELLALSQDKAYRAAIESMYKAGQSRGMEANWVFVGSGFYENLEGQKRYKAEDGDLISIANFEGAMIDVNTRSSNDNGALVYEAWTERVPPDGTEVTIEITPIEEKK